MDTMPRVSSAFLKLEEEQGYSRDDVTIASGQNLAAGTNLIRKEIDDAQKNRATTCTFDADWVRLYNASFNPDTSSKD